MADTPARKPGARPHPKPPPTQGEVQFSQARRRAIVPDVCRFSSRPPVVATYSIAACDLETGQWGVATQSKFLAVGSVVPWAEPHVGAIATQAYANPRYGPDGLALLREGLTADQVVERLTSSDEGRDHRQLGLVDAEGRSATFTGSECNEWAGGRTGAIGARALRKYRSIPYSAEYGIERYFRNARAPIIY